MKSSGLVQEDENLVCLDRRITRLRTGGIESTRSVLRCPREVQIGENSEGNDAAEDEK